MFSGLSYKQQKIIVIFAFAVVPVILLITFTYIPAFNLFRYSLYDWDGLADMKYIGFDNYKTIISGENESLAAFKNSLYYFAGSFIQQIFAFFMAFVVNKLIKSQNFFKAIFYFPSIVNSVAVGLIFIVFYQKDPMGTLDSFMKAFGLSGLSQEWLNNPDINNWCLVFASLWRYWGFNFIVYLGAIQSISTDVLEASEIDGATEWQKVKYIYLPSIRRVVEINVIMSVAGSISAFEIPYLVAAQGANGTSTFVIETVKTAFQYNSYGLASAMGCIMLLIVAIVTLIQRKFFKEG